MKIRAILLSSFLLLGLAGCSTNNQFAANLGLTPSAAKSEYLRTKGAGFTITRADGTSPASCKYAVIVQPAKPLSGPLYLRTQFENPARPKEPYVVDSEMAQDAGRLVLNSPPVHGLQPYTNYKIEILIYDSADRTTQIGKHTQWVQWASLARF